MIKFSGTRFRELCDKADMAVVAARQHYSPDELELQLFAFLPDGTEMFNWDHDRMMWLSTVIDNTSVKELIPFITRRDCLHQVIAEHSKELESRFIIPNEYSIALHPAIYFAAGKANVVEEGENVVFDRESFSAALAEWVQIHGY